MLKSIKLRRWCAAAPDHRIGIRYQVVRVAMGHRSVMAYARRSLRQARLAAVRIAGELLEVVPPDDGVDEPVKPLATANGLRVYVGDEPVDFLIEEDTHEGCPN
jgi:hypothetical protein